MCIRDRVLRLTPDIVVSYHMCLMYKTPLASSTTTSRLTTSCNNMYLLFNESHVEPGSVAADNAPSG
eukprot:1477406-Prorocentrum_lima.AAC.1